MKCPKCGYHSFEYLDHCKKCNNDLSAFKSKYHLRSLIFPQRTEMGVAPPAPPAPAAISDGVAAAAVAAPVAVAAATDFGFDFMEEEPGSAAQPPSSVETPIRDAQPAPEPAVAEPFSWDDAPVEGEAPAPTTVADTEAFDWKNADEDPASGEPEVTASGEEAAPDDSFGLDLSWDTELPPLDDALALEDAAESPEADGLSDWDFEEEPLSLETRDGKPKQQEQPRDPFESRESSMADSAPVSDRREVAPEPGPELAATRPGAVTADVNSPIPLLAELPTATGEMVAALTDADLTDRPAPRETVPAVWSRGVALGVDLLLLIVAILLFMMAGQKALAPVDSRPLLPTLDHLVLMAIPYFLVLFSLSFGYFTLFHFLTGQTPGKMLLRLRVETEAGSPLNFSHAFLRSTGGLFSLLLCGLGFLGIFLTPERRGWNDRMAGTLVVIAHPGGSPNPPETDGP